MKFGKNAYKNFILWRVFCAVQTNKVSKNLISL